MNIKFWSSKNLKEGGLILISLIFGAIASIIPMWFARYLMAQNYAIGGILGLLSIVWFYHVTGWAKRRFF